MGAAELKGQGLQSFLKNSLLVTLLSKYAKALTFKNLYQGEALPDAYTPL